MSAVMGIFGSIVGLIAAVISGAVVVTVIVVFWKSGALPEIVGLFGDIVSMAGAAIAGFFSFLGIATLLSSLL